MGEFGRGNLNVHISGIYMSNSRDILFLKTRIANFKLKNFCAPAVVAMVAKYLGPSMCYLGFVEVAKSDYRNLIYVHGVFVVEADF